MSTNATDQPDDSQSPVKVKIFPRNLTAHADYIVKGNPPTSRPESGVDNCYPGLEFDQRNLDKAFFPGLVFEFHHGGGAKLQNVVDRSMPSQKGLKEDDLSQPGGLYLWALIGRTTLDPNEDKVKEFVNDRGIMVWRVVHDLLPGRIAVLIAAQPPDGPESIPLTMISSISLDRFRQLYDAGESIIERDEKGYIKTAVLVDERAKYIDDNGVIDVNAYKPGDLTKTLCSPWQYDFRECGCFYWAANKPDIVVSEDGSNPNLNFLRKNRSEKPSDVDITKRENWYGYREYEHNDLIEGAWNKLPVVVNDRESELSEPSPLPPRPEVNEDNEDNN